MDRLFLATHPVTRSHLCKKICRRLTSIIFLLVLLAGTSIATAADSLKLVNIYGNSMRIPGVYWSLDSATRKSVSSRWAGAYEAFIYLCADAPSTPAILLMKEQASPPGLKPCAGVQLKESVIKTPKGETVFLYVRDDRLSDNRHVAQVHQALISELNSGKDPRKNAFEHECDTKPDTRNTIWPDWPVSITERGAAERIEAARMTVAPVVFVHKNPVEEKFMEPPSYCYLRVIAIDADSPFAKSLRVGDVFRGTSEPAIPLAKPPVPTLPPVETPKQMLERMEFAYKVGLNTIVWLLIYQSADANSVDPNAFALVSSYKALYDVHDAEPIKIIAECRAVYKRDCK